MSDDTEEALEEKSETRPKSFKSKKEVLSYLHEIGKKIQKSKLYEDIKAGFLRTQKDGTFRRRDVDVYSATLPAVALPEKTHDHILDLSQKELEEKIAKTRAQRLAIELDLQIKEGKYVLRDDVYLELASRAAALDMSLKSVFRLYAPDYIRLVGGDVTKSEELCAEFEKNLNTALTEYSKPILFETEYVSVSSDSSPA